MAHIAIAQVITGDVLGTVTDPNGAVVPNAVVTIRSLETQAARTAQSSANGDFSISLLPAGHYMITVDASGFKKFKVSDLTLSAGDRARVDVKLNLGSASETVEVQATEALLQTDSSSVGGLVTEQSVQDLPLNGRNLTNLVTEQVGVNAGLPGNITSGARPDDRRQTSSVSANGQMEYFNSNMLDGIDNNERFYGLGGIKPSIDGIDEVKVDTNSFPAEEGRSAGAVVTVVTKSGGNDFHGTLYEYFRNDIFDSEDHFQPSGSRKPEYRQNQYGGSVGGPVIKNKTFFFYDVEQLRIVQGITSPMQLVPDAADRAEVAALPASVGQSIFDLYPAANVGTNFYVSSPSKTQKSTTMDARVDQHFTANDTLFARYSYNPVTSTFPCYFPMTNGFCPGGSGFISNGQFPGTNNTTGQGAQINYTHVFNPSLLMELRAGFMRLHIDSETINSGTNAAQKLGIVGADIPTVDPNATGMTGLHFLDGYADLGDQIAYPIKNINNTFQYNGDVVYTHGAHNVKVGAALLRRQLNYLQDFEPQGWIFFLNVTPSSDSAPVMMAKGLPGVVLIRQNMYSYEYFRSYEPSMFAQDDWHLRPWLTLNLGVRYDIFTPFTEAKNRMSNFDLDTMTMKIGGTGGIKTDYSDIAPRVGFSAQLGHQYVLRGGFGMSYYPGDFSGAITLFNAPYNNQLICSPIQGTCGNNSAGQPLGTFTNGLPQSPAYLDPAVVLSPTSTLSGVGLVAKQTNWRAAYLEQYNLILQKQIGATVLTAGYVGSLGRRQVTTNGGEDANLPTPDSTGTYQVVQTSSGAMVPHKYATQLPAAGNIAYYLNEATSNYNALQMIFERRAAKGLTINANYTYAHGLNDWLGYDSAGAPAEWPGNRRYDWGNSDIDIRHRIAVTFTYEMPFGKNLNGAKALALKGWLASSSSYWQTGLPITVVDGNKPDAGGGAFNDFNYSIRTNVVPGQSYYTSSKSPSGYLNPAAFSPAWTGSTTATTFTLGNEHSQQVFGPHMRQVDLSLYKTQTVWDNLKVQFRAEAYNISNTANYAEPANDMNAPSTFGQILSTAQGTFPRQFQFALKLMF